jgi:integrase
MKEVLTDKLLKSLKPAPEGKRYERMDAVVPGFGVRVTDKVTKDKQAHRTFILFTRYPGKRHPARREIGQYGDLSLEKARDKAREWRELIRKGIDPKEHEAELRRAELRRQSTTFKLVAEDYINRHVTAQRRAAEAESIIRRELIGRWGDRPLDGLTRRDVIAMVEQIVGKGTPEAARAALAQCKALINWAVARDMLEHSPADHVNPAKLIGEKKSRQRVLTDDELRAFWKATERLSYPFGAMCRLLLFTGTRKDETAGARWREFDLEQKTWAVPPERFKSNTSHLVPLTDDALAELDALPRLNKGDHLFSTTFGAVPVSGFSKAKARLDKLMAEELGVPLPPWVLHDLRRTVRTRLASLRVPDATAEMILGHGRKGLQRVYDQHQYADEMREALTLWAARLRSIIEPPPENVVKMPTRTQQ